MKKYIYPLALATSMLAAVSCGDDEVSDLNQNSQDTEKEMISFSLTDGAGTRAGFSADTKIVMRIQSDSKVSGESARYTRTDAVGKAETSGSGYSSVEFVSSSGVNNVRYWDDAHGRNSQLSVFAIAVPGKSDLSSDLLTKGDNSKVWGAESSNSTSAWSVTKSSQTSDKQAAEDLVYSNNIQSSGKDGVYTYDFTNSKYVPESATGTHTDGQMKFQLKNTADPSSPGKFNRGHLKFQHALTRLTVNIVKDAGFSTSDPFNFKESTQITLHKMPYSGTLDVKAGTWTIASETGYADIIGLNKTTTDETAAGTYLAQFLPGYSFSSAKDDNVLSFTIDGNTYYVTQKDVHKALKDNAGTGDGKNGLDATATSYTMEQGKNYVLTIKVAKTQINSVTATLAEWATVTATENTPNNSRITLSLEAPQGTSCPSFDLYRLPQTRQASESETTFAGKDWNGNYTDYVTTKSTAEASQKMTPTNNVWTTPWYYQDNLTYYHFRTVNEGTEIKESGTTTDDYFEIASGTTDYHWGAPMLYTAGDNFKYNTSTGYTSALSPAIGSTNSEIKIQEVHAMSKINIILKTVSGDEGVKLLEGSTTSKVELTYFYDNGQVKMGTGLVTPSGAIKDKQEITPPATTAYYTTEGTESKAYTYYVVPQALVRTEGDNKKVGITITTPDNNTYYVVDNLATIKPTSVGNQAGQQHSTDTEIDRWYPNHSYTYTFILKKKKIESITCTVADWAEVKAADTTIDLEN